LALASGLVGTITEARRATRHAALAEGERLRADKEARVANVQRDFALRQLSRAEAINDLNSFLLSGAAPSGKPFTVGELLTRAEDVVGKERGESEENRVEILIAIGRQYDAQDEGGKARRVLGSAYELSKNLPERSLRAKAACALGSAVVLAGETERAERLIREGLDDLPNEPQFALDRVFCFLRGSEVAREGGDANTGVQRVEAAQRLLKESHLASAHWELSVWMDLAESNRMAGHYREAVAAFSETFRRLSALGRDETETARTVLNNWALVIDVHRPLEAERLFRRAVRINSADATLRGVSPMLLNNLARVLADLHRLPEAADYANRAYTKARQAGAETAVNQSLLLRASVYRQLGDLGRAATLLSEVEQRYRRMLPGGHPAFGGLASSRALLAQARGDFPAARAAADQAVAIAGASTPQYLPLVLLRRSNLELQMHLFEEARADGAKALGLWQQTVELGSFSSAVGRCYLALGRALQGQGKLGEARAAFASALEHLQPTLGADHPETRDARNLLASTHG
jgi:tetratricopeptide (TPR) repeat protein